MSDDPLEVIKGIAESHRQVKFGPGVVGKTGYGVWILLGVWGLIAFRLSENAWLNLSLLGAGIAASCVYVWWVRTTQAFATANPALALTEGLALLEYKKFEAGVKGLPAPKEAALTTTIPEPPDIGHA